MQNTILKLLSDLNVNADVLPHASPTDILPNVLRIVFGIAALLSVIFIAYGGFKYTTSNGDSQGISSAKNTILAAVVGLIIAVSAFTIISFVVGKIG
jgi:hypothetical protein